MAELCHLVVVTGTDVPDNALGAFAALRLTARGLTYDSFVFPPGPFNPGASLYLALDPLPEPVALDDGAGGQWRIEPPAAGACHLWNDRASGASCPNHAACPYRAAVVRVSRATATGDIPVHAGAVDRPNLFPLDYSPRGNRASGPSPPIARAPNHAFNLNVLPPVAIPTVADEESFTPGPTLLRKAVVSAPGRAHTRTEVAVAGLDLPGVRDTLLLDASAQLDLDERAPPDGAQERGLRVSVSPATGSTARAIRAWEIAHAAANLWTEPTTDALADWLAKLLLVQRAAVPDGVGWVIFEERNPTDTARLAAELPGHEYPGAGTEAAFAERSESWLTHAAGAELGRWLPALSTACEALDVFSAALLREFLDGVLTATLGAPAAGGSARVWLPLVRLFDLALARLPAYLLRPDGVNPWRDRLADWWLAPPDRASDAPTATTLRCLETVLSSAALLARPILATGYLGRSGERFVLGEGASALGTPEDNRPADGTTTKWGELFRRFPYDPTG